MEMWFLALQTSEEEVRGSTNVGTTSSGSMICCSNLKMAENDLQNLAPFHKNDFSPEVMGPYEFKS